MAVYYNAVLLGVMLCFPVVEPFFIGALKTLIGAKLLGGIGSSGSSESQRSSVGFYADSQSGQSSYEGLPPFPMSASYSAQFHAPYPAAYGGSPAYYSPPVSPAAYGGSPAYYSPPVSPAQYGGSPYAITGNPMPAYSYQIPQQLGNMPSVMTSSSTPVYGYPVEPQQYSNVVPANDVPNTATSALPLGAYSPYPVSYIQFLPVYGGYPSVVPASVPQSSEHVTPSIPAVPVNPVSATPGAGTIDLSTLLRLAQAAESLPSATLQARMGAGASVNAAIGQNEGSRSGRQEPAPLIPEETLERYFEFLQQIDQDSCLSRLVCEVTADANAYGVYGRLYGRMISNYFLGREEKPNSHLTPFVEAAKLGQSGTQGCAGSYSNCTLDLPHIVQSVRM